MPERVVALLPMRHHSQRVPGKNYRPLAGRPLFHHVLESLLACPRIQQVVIDTDSRTISEDTRRNFPQVRLLERPPHLRDGRISMNRVLRYDLEQVEADIYLQTHSTNPLLTTATITRALERFQEEHPRHDSLFSVCPLQGRLWDGRQQPLNHDPDHLLPTQEMEPLYLENSCLYIFTAESLRATGNRIGRRPLMFIMDPLESWDIDHELDFEIAQFLFLKYRKGKSP